MPDGSSSPRSLALTPASWDAGGWARAWNLGFAEGQRAAAVAIPFIEEADRALAAANVSNAARSAIWQQALDDVRRQHPDLPKLIRRAVAGRRIAAMVRERLGAR